MKTIPKKGDRVRLKSVNIKGTVFYVDTPTLFANHMYPIQVELDKPHDEHGQTMYRTNLPDLVKLKQTTPEKENPSHGLEKGITLMIMVKKKTGYEPTSAKIINVTDMEVQAKCTSNGVTKTKNIPIDKFLKQRHRFTEMQNVDVTKKRKKKPKEKKFDEEVFDF